ncbi:hypothetical protein OSB04_026086 [Centaurea solstitialis]|uniref:Dof zinc finger protein n=1 Tax=Centaurea solstitialis TaxID=347529 RepID=A0AA38SB97_9ASTR|nr:hypothetical protein OSB04_026086 [Centaurea solstitialis]
MEEKKAIRAAEREKPQALKCPRCSSSHTKFCYYNNYNLSQPRYFCKTCRRYWTAGGSLRNVPVGGASRKNKLRPSSSSSSSSSTYDHRMMIIPPPNYDHQPPSQNPNHHHHHIIQNHGSLQHHHLNSSTSSMGFFKASTTTTNDYATGGMMMMMNSFMPMPLAPSSTTNPMASCVDDDQKNINVNVNHDHQETSTTTRGHHDDPSTGARLFFPLEDLKPTSASTTNTTIHHQLQGQGDDPNSYWSGGGSW